MYFDRHTTHALEDLRDEAEGTLMAGSHFLLVLVILSQLLRLGVYYKIQDSSTCPGGTEEEPYKQHEAP